MGNRLPSPPSPLRHSIDYVGHTYIATKTLYLQKSLLNGTHLKREGVDPRRTTGDFKLSVQQYLIPAGSRIDITHTSTSELRGTIHLMGQSLLNVIVDDVVQVLRRDCENY